MNHVGIDYKKNMVSVATIDDTNRHAINLYYEHDMEGKAEFVTRLKNLIIVLDPEVIAIERALIYGFARSDRTMVEVHQIIEMACGMAAQEIGELIEVISVMPTQWKKKILGSGKADKKASILHTGYDDHNLADAMCLAEYAKIYYIENKNNENMELVTI